MKKSIPAWVIVVIVIVVIVIIVLSVGLLMPDLAGKEATNESEEDKERRKREARQKQISELKAELNSTNEQLGLIEAKFEDIKRQEKNVLFASRLCIGGIIIAFDILFLRRFGWSERELIGDLLKFNSALVASYSFVAFITHGTPAKFAVYLKSKIRSALRWYHKSVYMEYDRLKFDRALLITLIESLESPIVDSSVPGSPIPNSTTAN